MRKMYEFKGEVLEEFKRAVRDWADRHPDKGPLVHMGGNSYTAQQIAASVENQTPFGKSYTKIMEDMCNHFGDKLPPQELFARMRHE